MALAAVAIGSMKPRLAAKVADTPTIKGSAPVALTIADRTGNIAVRVATLEASSEANTVAATMTSMMATRGRAPIP